MVFCQIQYFSIDLLFFMQIIEWSLIIFIINEQRKLQESEITHLHTRESRMNTFKVGFAMNSSGMGTSITYRDKEQRVTLVFFGALATIFVSWLFLFVA